MKLTEEEREIVDNLESYTLPELTRLIEKTEGEPIKPTLQHQYIIRKAQMGLEDYICGRCSKNIRGDFKHFDNH